MSSSSCLRLPCRSSRGEVERVREPVRERDRLRWPSCFKFSSSMVIRSVVCLSPVCPPSEPSSYSRDLYRRRSSPSSPSRALFSLRDLNRILLFRGRSFSSSSPVLLSPRSSESRLFLLDRCRRGRSLSLSVVEVGGGAEPPKGLIDARICARIGARASSRSSMFSSIVVSICRCI